MTELNSKNILPKIHLSPKIQTELSQIRKQYKYPPNLILNIDKSLKKDLIYEKEILNITNFTNKFKGRMLTYQTHGLYIYPAKFIPQIPQFCIQRFSKPHDIILDPFCGSGTTLVEALLLHRNAYGIDLNPLARLISKVKTTSLDLFILSEEFKKIEQFIISINNSIYFGEEKCPYFPNLSYWFSPKVLQELMILQNYIFTVPNSPIRNFFLLILASIIRDVSLADEDQLHPAKTRYSMKKETLNIQTYEIFKKSLHIRLPIIKEFSKYDFSDVNVELIGEDATRIRCPTQIDLAITSPPYVNALDYIRIHKLEAFWTGLLSPTAIHALHQKFIGTENVYKSFYHNIPSFSNNELNNILSKIASFDKKRAGIVALYFSRMLQNLREVYRLLRPEGHYCIIIGSNNIRNIHIPTPKILIQFAEDEIGFKNVLNYSYNVINKRLKIPRAHYGGNIKKEWIIVLQKL